LGFEVLTCILKTKERDEEELQAYHKKVYRACKQMEESHERELRRLGVPFFGVRENLLRADGGDGDAEEKEGEGKDPRITKKQLAVLKRKMLEHLVDLYGD
jgi:hypothetical protein